MHAVGCEPTLAVDRSLTSHARGRDRLAIHLVGQVAGGEHALDVRLVDYWKLDEATLTLLTKSELVPLANEVGLVPALGGEAALKKALALPKPEAIKALLGVQGFDYRVAPSFMSL